MNLFTAGDKSVEDILTTLESYKEKDIPWEEGRAFALTYKPPTETYELIKKAFNLFLSENALDPTSFPSILKLEKEVIQTALDLMNAPVNAAGTFTFGGTESIFLAVKAARDYCRAKKRIKKPNIVLPVTAHAAFHKACHYLGVEARISAVDEVSFKANIEDLKNQIDKNTIMIVASAPSYAHGVVDGIEAIGQIAISKKVLFHVDACVGGMYLPFAKQLGYDIPNFDFSVEGVSSISLDFHKYGYTAKGASCIMFKEDWLREYQIYSCSKWTGYSIINPTVLSSKSAGSLAACWATLSHISSKGYQDLAKQCQEATRKMINAINEIPELAMLGNPSMNLIAFESVKEDLSVFHLMEVLKKKGWFTQVQFQNEYSPESIHLSINYVNVPFIDEFIADLKIAIQESIGNTKKSLLTNPVAKMLLKNISGQTFMKLQKFVGMSGDELPEDLEEINQVLNSLPSNKRDAVLTLFMNQILAKREV